jgi:hypothetical protein
MHKKFAPATLLVLFACAALFTLSGCRSSDISPQPSAQQSPPTADIRMPGIFSHNMVLQQGIPVPIWGWAE